ncbi:uncharacterized protein F5Z01DRAFT_637998 [Emericellopsis atlantica]|uniref:Uncharacterized protein n=1 Tax=Emericellopsis atlantica TaxID=2614577 RepID=A0A9P7ZIN1_9HYPO|nr:uncharacterized protein F5Z01DRAFT_637998 [Emericellopsis atlantica]KAG9252833.1 hypothetical protein F5Z01DRAFT_637998 [Emericellopsis atlantica]
MPAKQNNHDGPQTLLTLCSTIALGALIAKNLPPEKKSSSRRRSRFDYNSSSHRYQRSRPSRTASPARPRVPPLQDRPYREQRSYIHYPPQHPGDKGETLYIIDQRPLGSGWTGPEVTWEEEDEEEEERRRQQRQRGVPKTSGNGPNRDDKGTPIQGQTRNGAYQVRRYYRWNGEEAGPDEPRTTVEEGWPKWD